MKRMKTTGVKIDKEDFGILCICALRYCHGRRTYMPSLVQGIVRRHFADLSERDLVTIAADEKFQKDMELWGDECDKKDWERFYRSLRERIKGADDECVVK